MRACMWTLVLGIVLGPSLQAWAQDIVKACICVDSFSHFLGNASDVYKADIARRLAAEADAGVSSRQAIQHIWESLEPHAATESSFHRRPSQLDVCKVRARAMPRLLSHRVSATVAPVLGHTQTMWSWANCELQRRRLHV